MMLRSLSTMSWSGTETMATIYDQHAKQHAEPVFPWSMSTEEAKVRHSKPPLKRRHTSAAGNHDTPNQRPSGRFGAYVLWEN
jgi:hypothetical protein